LWSHPKVIVTPHLSGDTEGEFDIATDIAIENAKRIRNGEQILNLVDFERGY
jgi:phosphoglycerate dehydrogenase-like enzyme